MTAAKLIAVDLDGTLLDRRGAPHPRDMSALRAALREGVHVSIITGRLYSGTRSVVEQLGLRGAVGCADGSHLVDAHRHATLLHLGIGGSEANLLRNALARASLTTFVFADDAIGHDAAGAPFVEYVKTWSTDLRPSRDVFAHDLWNVGLGVTGVIGVGPQVGIENAAREIVEHLGSAAVVVKFPIVRKVHLGLWAVIVRAAGGTKGTALRFIADHERVALEHTVCVGDWINDVAMFELAGRSFAMGQAPNEVKAKASDVLEETAERGGGVARAVEQVFGIVGE